MRQCVAVVGLVWCFIGLSSLAGAQPTTVSIPLDGAWQRESAGPVEARMGFRDQCKDEPLGVRSVASISPSDGRLVTAWDLRPGSRDHRVGEVYRYLADLRNRPLPDGALGQPWGLDLTGATIRITIEVPDIREGFAQIFVESENPDGIAARYYGPNVDIDHRGRITVEFELKAVPLQECQTYLDVFFDVTRVVRAGLALALDRTARRPFAGQVAITEATIRWASKADRDKARKQAIQARAEALKKRPAPTDRELWNKLSPLSGQSPDAPSTMRVSSANVMVAGGAASVAVKVADTPSPVTGAQALQVSFSAYRPEVAARSARAWATLPEPINMLGRTVSASVAIDRTLRGVLTRPHQVQIELYDVDGRVFRGPAEGLSGSILFSPAGVEQAATWVKVEATPFEGELPQTMGHKTPGFRADAVVRIGIRFEIGKNSDTLLGPTTAGSLLSSDFLITGNPVTAAGAAPPRGRQKAQATQSRTGALVVGINYGPGTDVGLFPYGGRDLSRGFSANRQQLEREFELFCSKGVDVVRVFLLGDLRTGLTYNAAGYVSGLDSYVLKDLDALIETAATHGIKLIPVLVDFLAADGVAESRLLDRVVKVGESPQVFVNAEHRRPFVEYGLRPIVQKLVAANQAWPGLIYAIDIANEIENAKAIFTPRSIPAVVDFVRTVRDMIRTESRDVPVTLGSRDRDALVSMWSDLSLEVDQFHFYDKMEEEEARPLSYPVRQLGLAGPVILGEVEPSNITAKLDTIDRDGYDAALFWSWRGLDGYVVNLDEIAAWKRRKRASLGLDSQPDSCTHR